ncbi:MAG: recombinase family protein, partial [Rhodospirillales bacterium]|nr:recombinase family protein [Rhodospirillales bacterium]
MRPLQARLDQKSESCRVRLRYRLLQQPAKAKAKAASAQATTRRCAIYTRKSSEEGLEQEFNSLDAQREACEAFIRSQRHEGWVLLPAAYDDGGISGGTLERPALQHLLADIRAGRVDLVIVYKVDRLTRSLADFAKIVEVFDAHGASFVSVTQQFNTATSMGRLTLNMLLSFAQFEREVTGERIRDKIAASKCKGMWMGGNLPLGYDVHERKLVINETEAATVRHIYRTYLTLGSVRLLQEHLAASGVRSKLRPAVANARMRGGQVLVRGALYLMLQNHLYRGEVVHRGNAYPGEHEAIISPDLWEAVQARLEANRVDIISGTRAQNPSLLAGLIHDAAGERLLPTHATKGERRYRYYVSKALQTGGPPSAAAAMRIPAGDIERAVADRLTRFLADRAALYPVISAAVSDGAGQAALLDRAAALASAWPEHSLGDRRVLLRRLVGRITAHPTHIDLRLDANGLIAVLHGDAEAGIGHTGIEDTGIASAESAPAENAPADHPPAAAPILLTIPIRLKRAGMEMRMLVEGAGSAAEPDATLIKLILRARHLRNRMLAERL